MSKHLSQSRTAPDGRSKIVWLTQNTRLLVQLPAQRGDAGLRACQRLLQLQLPCLIGQQDCGRPRMASLCGCRKQRGCYTRRWLVYRQAWCDVRRWLTACPAVYVGACRPCPWYVVVVCQCAVHPSARQGVSVADAAHMHQRAATHTLGQNGSGACLWRVHTHASAQPHDAATT